AIDEHGNYFLQARLRGAMQADEEVQVAVGIQIGSGQEDRSASEGQSIAREKTPAAFVHEDEQVSIAWKSGGELGHCQVEISIPLEIRNSHRLRPCPEKARGRRKTEARSEVDLVGNAVGVTVMARAGLNVTVVGEAVQIAVVHGKLALVGKAVRVAVT